MKHVALALMALLRQGAQDEEKIPELIRLLGNESIQTRENARKELLEIGKAALPTLHKAADDPDAERKARVRRIISEIEWKPLRGRDVAKDLTNEERQFLGEVGLLTRTNPHFLLRSLEAHEPLTEWLAADTLPPKHEVWSFVRQSLFERANVKGGHRVIPAPRGNNAEHWDKWFIAGDVASLTLQSHYEHVARGASGIHAYKYLPYALLETRESLDLSREALTWDQANGILPCLKGFMAQGRKNVSLQKVRTFEKDGKITGAYYQFDWDQKTGTMNTLRHLFVKEHWALWVVFTW